MTGREFTEKFLPLADNFYKVAYYLLEDSGDAEDAVQNLYIKLWNMLDSLDSVRNPKAYGIMMMRNMCLDIIRRKSRINVAEKDEDAISDDAGPDEILSTRENLSRVSRAMSKLPSVQREVLTLKVIEGLSYDEIQERTGMSYISLRVRLSQARNMLRKYYEKD